jgi:hypothetical protein
MVCFALLVALDMLGRPRHDLWKGFYALKDDVPRYGLKSKRNSAHRNAWCRPCVDARLLDPTVILYKPDDTTSELELKQHRLWRGE